jgi:hypothetical protein
MQTNLTWKKGVFSNLYKIYSNGEQIGNLKDKSFFQSGIGVLDNKEYLFQTKGFFKQMTQIIDTAENKTVGEITYNNWMTKATITINGKTINWKYDNLWNTKWSIFNSEGIKIQYSGSSTGGQIETNLDDALLLLTGLFVTNYYWQMTVVVLVAVFVPIWTTVLI